MYNKIPDNNSVKGVINCERNCFNLVKTDSLNTKPSINLKNLTNYYLNVKKHLLSASLPSERHRQFL